MKAKRSILDVAEARWSFSVEDARRIIELVGKPPKLQLADYPEGVDGIAESGDPVAAALAWHLNNTAFDLRWQERRQSMPSPKAVAKRAAEIASLCEQLLSKTQDGDGVLFDGLGPGALWAFANDEDGDAGAQAVQHALGEVARLGDWSKRVSARASSQAALKPSRPGRKVDEAWHHFIDRLGGVYYIVWQEMPGKFSRLVEGPSGPYFKFVRAITDKLLPRLHSDQSITETLREHRWPEQKPSAAALREAGW